MSAYAWLAAWLSVGAANIYLKVSGLFNPMQAPSVFEVAQGDYAELAHHYLAIGRARGHRPCPPGAGEQAQS